jgi:hypothetical protein
VTAAALPDWLVGRSTSGDLIEYDVFASIHNAGKHAFLASWRDRPSAEIQPARLCRPPPSSRARRPRLRHVRSTLKSSILSRDLDRDGGAARAFLIAGHEEEPPC